MKADTQQPEGINLAAGIDMAAGELIAARKPGLFRPWAYSKLPWPRPGANRSASEGFNPAGMETVGVLPVGQALTVWLEAPFASRAKAWRVFPSLLDIRLPFPIEECVFGFFRETARSGTSQKALAVAARLETVRARLEVYRQAGFDPMRLDYEGFALWTQALEECDVPIAWRVVLSVEPGRAALAVGQGTRFNNAHNIRLPEKQNVVRTLSEALPQLLSAEISADAKLEWVVTGPSVKEFDLSTVLAGEHIRLVHEPAGFLARALAARAVGRGPLRCNLREGENIHPLVARRARAKKRKTWQALACAALCVCVLNGAWPFWCSARMAALDRAIKNRAQALAPGATLPRGMEVREAQLYQASLRPFLEAWSDSLISDLGLAVQTASASGVKITALHLQRGALSLEGRAESWRQAETMAEGIKALGWVVELQRGQSPVSGGLAFVLKGKRQQ